MTFVQPLDQTGINAIEMWTQTITNQYSREKLAPDLKTKDPWTIAKQLFTIASQEAYVGIREGEAPSEEYLTKRFETTKKLVALAGYRLADYLNDHLK